MLLHDKLVGYRIVLGSKSPRRRQLISDAGIEFELAMEYECDESYPSEMDHTLVPEYLSVKKSQAYPQPLGDRDILITADTVVLLNDKILGKPKDREDAIGILQSLSGNTHRVITGVTLRSADKMESFSVSTDVCFSQLRKQEIEYYVDTYKPFDKAGSYGIQEWIGYIGIESINGSFYNVMGLPIQRLYGVLERFIEQP